jgi:hypothetical protein
MPLVRGRILPAVELAGRAKRILDVLLWLTTPRAQDLGALDELEVLRKYLDSMDPPEARVRLWVPREHFGTINALTAVGIDFSVTPSKQAGDQLWERLKGVDRELSDAVATALMLDADCLVTDHGDWFPYIEEVEKFSTLIMDCGFLLRNAEVFVRGHDVPWNFESKVWNQPWQAFYVLTEQRTFKAGMDLLRKAFDRGASAEAQRTGNSLVYNRISNLCFTRDRLRYYETQRLAARRAGWKRQDFDFELPYYLNFYYVLIYGAFDHAALLVNQFLELGLGPRQVGATYESFLGKLKRKSASVYAVFTSDANRKFVERIGTLRHLAAHRASIALSQAVEKPDHEPTEEELDADIKASGKDELIRSLPEGKIRDDFRAMARAVARA